MRIKHFIFIVFLFVFTLPCLAQFSVSGGLGTPFEYTKNLGGTGIEKVYFLNTFSGASISYTSSAALIRFYKYTSSLSDKQQIPDSDISSSSIGGGTTTYTIRNLEDSKGYFAEINGGTTAAIWIIDYSKHLPELKSISPLESEDKCGYLKLLINKSDDLFFYTNSGNKNRIVREYQVEYNILQWNETAKQFEKKINTEKPIDVGVEINIEAPLTDTQFTLKGDQIAQHFGIEKSVQSNKYTAVATEAHIVAEQVSESSETGFTEDIGGSAPAEVHFYGHGNEPTTRYYTWFIYKKPDLENPIARYTDKDIKYIFKESGDYTVKLEVADKSSACPSETSMDLSITEFSWDAPNFLLLDGTMQFRISYKSIIEFKCTIFNRWGNKIYEWTDPSKGWDGKYNGKYVNPGVYFYMMTAKSGDGKKHKKSGDINVLRKK
jgi:gliding motility-associated-like protein